MSDHVVTMEFTSGWPSYTMECTAPPESMCHAVYDCDCEGWSFARTVLDRPFHISEDDQHHIGIFKEEECTLRDWFENSDECLVGKITFPVKPSWEGDYYDFQVEEES